MSAPSAKALFRATKPKSKPLPGQIEAFPDLEDQMAPEEGRDPLDFDPTPPDATAAFLAMEQDHMRKHGNVVWENAVGAGHMASVLCTYGFKVYASDIVDRGHPNTFVRSFYEYDRAPAKICVTNPPYCEINARDGHGRWLKHLISLNVPYVALLLNADWPAARKNGLDALLEAHPPSIEYLCCWKIDFRGGGSPPQRNSFFVWDRNRPAPAPNTWLRTRLYREANSTQEALPL